MNNVTLREQIALFLSRHHPQQPVAPPKPVPVLPPSPIHPADPMLAAFNVARAAHHLPPLTRNTTLDGSSHDWAAKIALAGDLQHGDYEGRLAKVLPGVLGWECIADGYTDAAAAVAGWLNEPNLPQGIWNHRAIILGPANVVGWAMVPSPAGLPFYVADFARLNPA